MEKFSELEKAIYGNPIFDVGDQVHIRFYGRPHDISAAIAGSKVNYVISGCLGYDEHYQNIIYIIRRLPDGMEFHIPRSEIELTK